MNYTFTNMQQLSVLYELYTASTTYGTQLCVLAAGRGLPDPLPEQNLLSHSHEALNFMDECRASSDWQEVRL